MRRDMAKVIVERERVKGRATKGRRKENSFDQPAKQSMKKAHGDRKSLNENLAPLKRYLMSQVGRPWDEVFSEICANLKLTSAVQKHVRDHVFDFVKLNVFIENKKVYGIIKYLGPRELFNDSLYVDPKTGILRHYKRATRKFKREPKDHLIIDLNQLLNRPSIEIARAQASGNFIRIEKSKDDTNITSSLPLQRAHARLDHKVIVRTKTTEEIGAFLAKYEGAEGLSSHPYFSELFTLLGRS